MNQEKVESKDAPVAKRLEMRGNRAAILDTELIVQPTLRHIT